MKASTLCLLSMLIGCITPLAVNGDETPFPSTDITITEVYEEASPSYDDPPSLFAVEQPPPPFVFSVPRCPFPDPMTYTVMLPYPGNCSRFYMCSNGFPFLMNCSKGLHFNPSLSVCDWPWNSNCREGCFGFSDDATGKWNPPSCSADTNKLGATCSLQCEDGYVLKGSAYVQCTPDGWNSTNGKYIPECLPEECIGEDLENELNQTLSVPASLLFVLDESGSVGNANFEITKEFVKDIVSKFPLSNFRSAGVITFASNSKVPIPLDFNFTYDFTKFVDQITYKGGGTDILDALNTAYSEIQGNQVHPLTLLFLITDGMSQTDGTSAADKIKAANHPLFAVGIGNTKLVHLEALSSRGDNGIKHFFHIQDYDILKSIGQYLNPPPGSGGSTSSSVCRRP